MNNNLPKGVCVLVDGGCLNNNRPVSERHMYGSLTVFYDGKQVASTWTVLDVDQPKQLVHKFELGLQGDGEQWASNNLAELMMVNYALSYVFALQHRPTKSGKTLTGVTILSDSEWALGVASGDMKIKKTSHSSLHDEALAVSALENEIAKWGGEVTYKHVDNVWVKGILGH